MSQAKVDRYKEEKKNRKQLIKKAKREWMAVKAGLTVVLLHWLHGLVLLHIRQSLHRIRLVK